MRVLLLVSVLSLSLVVPLGSGGSSEVDWSAHASCAPGERESRRAFVERPGVEVVVHALCDLTGTGALPSSDCSATTYDLAGWRWSAAHASKVDATGSNLPASGVLAAFRASAVTWDDATSAPLSSSIDLGGKGRDAGRYNGIDQFGFKRLQPTTLAVTTTWYYTSTGLAVESDAAYNTRYAWSLTGESTKMDLQDIATHELGHTWGLGDLYDAADACLTMYGYGSKGDTHARTLGDGDHLGLHALYGP